MAPKNEVTSVPRAPGLLRSDFFETERLEQAEARFIVGVDHRDYFGGAGVTKCGFDQELAHLSAITFTDEGVADYDLKMPGKICQRLR